ncbi:1,4-beta-N-acetylmuramidase [Bifidobacterium pseudolongum subsp. globosum]|uniref:1,4-beta-N-acetylmuramidase n=1 Tax=Bifidobacterium pseudolongum subsp. globosum TaxID=1690 RepID=A0A4Q5A0L3_9BIFI|nr:Ig-like domain-containing protein [Bifidobacterium pseudolongum]RYQ08854.1 1,4-beta-N-acetylmuramidase [Bifidobacterium pseudolongum subsp. globosum]
MLSQKIRTMVGVTLACCLTASLTMSAAYAVDAETVTTTTQSAQARNNDFSIQGANILGNQLTMGVYTTENVTSDSVTIYNGNSSAWWSSSDNQVASAYTTATRTSTISFGSYSRTMVQIEGAIQGHAAGEADITLHIGDYSSTVHVTVRVIPVDSVHIRENDLSMYVGDSTTLSTYVSPSNATNQNVTLTSSDPSVVSVNGHELTARKLGTAKITATAGGKSTSITVTVAKRPVDTVTIQGDAVSNGILRMSALSSSKLNATVSPANATDRKVTWKSSDDKVASVAADGTVTAHKTGDATITASAGGKNATVKVVVHPQVEKVAIKGAHVQNGKLDITVFKTDKLTADVLPVEALDKTVTWKSSDDKKLSVSKDGVITAHMAGKVEVTVTAAGKSDTVTVTIGFKDVNNDTPHHEDIQWMANNDITTGYPDGNYLGMGKVFRQDMAAFLRREAQLRNIGDSRMWKPSAEDWHRFTDVNERTPHAEDILWLAHAGIAEGYRNADGTWRYEGMTFVYRQDMAAFLERIAKLAHKASSVKPKTDFTDVVAGQTPHYREIEWLGGSGIAQGYRNPNGTWRFEGMTPTYRQDMAAFIQRLNALLER